MEEANDRDMDRDYKISIKNIDKAIETLKRISTYEIDSGPRGDDARGDINLAILVLEKEKESLWLLKKFLEMRGD